jgi:uncharacterized protein (DUF1501 family)
MLTRRGFLQSSSLFALAPAVPLFLARTARAASAAKDSRVLVVVQLDGGNDALNTLVPHADPEYTRLRPRLKIATGRLVKLTDDAGLHPSLKPLDRLLQSGELAIVAGAGYPNPNRSHFESMAIWQTARLDAEARSDYGWVGRALDTRVATAFAVGNAVPQALRGRRSVAVSLNSLADMTIADPAGWKDADAGSDDLLAFVRRQSVDARATADRLAKLPAGPDGPSYPATPLGERLKIVARLLKADLGAPVFYTFQDGFDTHASQGYTHANLLSQFGGSVAAFFDDLRAAKLAERVTLLAFSEFGRTIRENASAGTDHGTAGVVFLCGPGIRGGIHGTLPKLTDLVGGEPKITTDFRRVYAAVLEGWLGLPAADVLGGKFEPLPIFRA